MTPAASLKANARRTLRPLANRWLPGAAVPSLATWSLSRSETGALAQRGHVLEPLLEKYGSPLFVVDRARLEVNLAEFSGVGPGPRAEIFYSYKTNPVPGVLAALHAAGAGAEVSSPYELWLALRLRVAPSAIVFDGPAKDDAALESAVSAGVGLINANARPELERISRIARRLGKRQRVGLRVGVPGQISGQFGERIDDGSAQRALKEALALPGLEVVALHAHLNGEIADGSELDRLIDGMFGFADTAFGALGFEPEILDFGGNLACPTVSHRSNVGTRLAMALGREEAPRSPEETLEPARYVAHLRERVAHHFQGRRAPRLFLEPGRAMTSSAQLLLTRVLEVRDPDASGLTWAVLDAGINIAEALRSEHHWLFPLRERPGAERLSYRLVGPSCTLGDLLFPIAELPRLEAKEALAVMDAGAYFIPYSTCFSFPRPAVVMLDGDREVVLRRAETFDDLVARDLSLWSEAQ